MSTGIKHYTDIANLIKLESNGIKIASYVEIREALINKFKFIYGNDIDVSPASADGQYIGELALLINNILQVVEYSYSSLDPASANGKYLDILASFNNITRINQSKSKASLTIRNIGVQRSDIDTLLFKDNNDNYWTWTNKKDIQGNNKIIFPAGTLSNPSYTVINDVSCDEPGKITAIGTPFDGTGPQDSNWDSTDRGTICQFVNDIPDFKIWQSVSAVVGNNEESDSSLRSRRYQLLGNQSISVLQGLQGGLLNLLGIKDVFIYNNSSNSATTLPAPTSDSTQISAHSIYVALRLQEGVTIPDANIGELIYNKLTPGILTVPYHNETTFDQSTHRGTTYPQAVKYTIHKTAVLTYDIYWKESTFIHPSITISYVPNPSLFNKDTIKDSVKEKLLDYLDNVSISGWLNPVEILSAMQKGDITNNPSNNTGTEKNNQSGIPTFFATSCTIQGFNAMERCPANLSYFKYNTFTWDTTNNTLTITYTV